MDSLHKLDGLMQHLRTCIDEFVRNIMRRHLIVLIPIPKYAGELFSELFTLLLL